jgi:hypothetical protein
MMTQAAAAATAAAVAGVTYCSSESSDARLSGGFRLHFKLVI